MAGRKVRWRIIETRPGWYYIERRRFRWLWIRLKLVFSESEDAEKHIRRVEWEEREKSKPFKTRIVKEL